MKFSFIHVGMLINMDFAGLGQVATLLRVQGSNISVLLFRGHHVADIFYLVPTIFLVPPLVPQVQGVGTL